MARSLEELREYLVGEWLFQSDFKDSSGNGNHGVPTDIEWKPTSRGLKPHGGKISFGDFTPTNVFTASIWVNAGEWENNYDSIFRLSDIQGGHPNSSNEAWVIYNYFTGNRIDFEIGNDSIYNRAMISYPYFPNNEWHMLTAVCDFKDDNQIRGYLDGQLMDATTITLENISSASMELAIGNYNNQTYDDVKYYNTSLTDDEVLALYESTKQAYGVQPAERSFTHRLQPDVDANTVVAFDMGTKNSDGTLMDLSGNNNHATVLKCVRDSSYFKDGLTFEVGERLECDIFDELIDNICWNFLIGPSDELPTLNAILWTRNSGLGSIEDGTGYALCFDGDAIINYIYANRTTTHTIEQIFKETVLTTKSMLLSVVYDFDSHTSSLYVDGELCIEAVMPEDVVRELLASTFAIGGRTGIDSYSIERPIYYTSATTDIASSQIIDMFNKLAVLPLYSLDCSKLPANTTTFTTGEFLPNSSIHVNSGEFQIISDAGYNQIKCVSSGSLRLLPAWEWDGDEYMTVTVDGEKYSGTGTITQGTVTASISQGSTAITLNMATDDVIDAIDIQFRKPVDD